MPNQIITYIILLLIIAVLVWLASYIYKSLLLIKTLKNFELIIHKELHDEIANNYMKLYKGEMDEIEFYEKSDTLGQLYSKIFEDYKNRLMEYYFRPHKGRMKSK